MSDACASRTHRVAHCVLLVGNHAVVAARGVVHDEGVAIRPLLRRRVEVPHARHRRRARVRGARHARRRSLQRANDLRLASVVAGRRLGFAPDGAPRVGHLLRLWIGPLEVVLVRGHSPRVGRRCLRVGGLR